MGAELGFVSLSQLQKLAQSQQNYQQTAVGSSAAWMWNPKQSQEDDDSWEVRAFEEDTGNAMGTTWPPRSYTCTFCRREFRSAQALGGHMNVHRRDRARLHQTQPPPGSSINHNSSASTSSSSTFIFPSQEFSTNGGGLCLLYQLPNPNGGAFTSTAINGCAIDSPSTLLSISPYMHNTLIGQPLNFPVAPPPQAPMNNSSYCYSNAKAEQPSSASNDSSNKINNSNSKESSPVNEELDLELRLGQRSPSP